MSEPEQVQEDSGYNVTSGDQPAPEPEQVQEDSGYNVTSGDQPAPDAIVAWEEAIAANGGLPFSIPDASAAVYRDNFTTPHVKQDQHTPKVKSDE